MKAEIFRENGEFLAVCLGVTVLCFALAWLLERLRGGCGCKGTKRLVTVAMCGALAGVLMLVEFPMPFLAPPFYKLDLGDLPAMLAGLWLGPTAGVAVELIKVLIKLLLKGTTSAFVGDFASFVAGCVLVLPASALCARGGRKRLALGLGASALALTAFASVFNALFLLPKFAALYGMPLEQILAMGTAIVPAVKNLWTFALWIVAPFNLFKGVGVGIVCFFLAPRLRKAIRL